METFFIFLHWDLGKTIVYKPMTDQSVLFTGPDKYNSDWNEPITDFSTIL